MIEKLILKGEGENLDFKQTISSLYKIAKTLCSFANTRGGKILIGVNDERAITGIDPEEERYMIKKAAEDFCRPPVPLIFKEFEFEEENKVVLLVNVAESKNKPHYAKNKENKWNVYIRVNDKSIPAGKTQIAVIEKGLNNKNNYKPDLNTRKVISYLGKYEKITVKQFMQLVNISKRRAQRILTELVLIGMLRIHEHEKEYYYTL